MEMDADGNVILKTPQAAIMAAIAYLASHPPPKGDPKRAMHKSVLTGLGLVGAALHREAPAEPKKKAAVRLNRIPTPSSEDEEHEGFRGIVNQNFLRMGTEGSQDLI